MGTLFEKPGETHTLGKGGMHDSNLTIEEADHRPIGNGAGSTGRIWKKHIQSYTNG